MTMRVLYYGAPECTDTTLKRLLVVAREIAFMDRPSVMLSKTTGTVGRVTQMRYIRPLDPKTGIAISAHAPYSEAVPIFREYLARDWQDARFREAVLDGLRNDAFAERMLHLDARYNGLTGRQIREALLADPDLRAPVLPPLTHESLFKIDTPHARIETLGNIVTEASIEISGGVVGASESGCVPITDSKTLAELLAIRGAGSPAARESGMHAILGAEIARAVLPDHVLAQMTFKDILEYRAASREAYDAWLSEVDQLAVRLEDLTGDDLHEEVKQIVMSVTPQITAYRRELASVRDRMLGDLVSSAPSWSVPAVLLHYVGGLSLVGSLVTALGSAGLKAAATHYTGKRQAKRAHGVSYLLGLVDDTKAIT